MYIVPEEKIEFIYCNVSAQDYDVWSPSVTYKTGDKVTVVADELNYFATKDIAVGVAPDKNDPKGLITGWFSETINRNKMLEKNVYNQTKNEELISFSFRTINIDTLSFLNVDANEIYIKISDFLTGVVVFEETKSLSDNGISLYHYFFEPAYFKNDITLSLPLFFYIKVEVEIRKPYDIAKCGKFLCGRSIDLGASIWSGSSIKTKRFGKVVQDDYFGNYEIEKGSIVNQITVPVIIDTKSTDYIVSVLKKHAFDYCLFIAEPNQVISNFTAYGLAEDTSFSPMPYMTQYTLKIGSTI